MLKIGICGFGTVGQSFVDHIVSHNDKIRSNISKDFDIDVIADRSIDKKEYPSGIKITKNYAQTHSIVMRSKTGTIRHINGEHNFLIKKLDY